MILRVCHTFSYADMSMLATNCLQLLMKDDENCRAAVLRKEPGSVRWHGRVKS
jgi:hypothetical protein